MRRTLALVRLSGSALVLVLLGVVGWLLGKYFWLYVIGGAVGAGIVFIMFPRWYRNASMKQARRLYSEGTNKNILGRQILDLDNDGLVIRSESGEEHTNWSAVERIETTPDYAFVYIGAISAHVIPRAKVVEGNFAEFVESVQQILRGKGID